MSKIFVFTCNSQYKNFFDICCKNDIDVVFNLNNPNMEDKVEFFSQDLSVNTFH